MIEELEMEKGFQMIDYIHDGPTAVRATLGGNGSAIRSLTQEVRGQGLDRIVICGLGSSYTAAMMAGPVFANHCPLETFIMPATEMAYYEARLFNERTLVVVVSRSGERGVVVDVLTQALERGAMGVAITGVADSLLAQNSSFTLLTREGEERAFPKTKSVIATAGLLMYLGLSLASPDDHEAAYRLETLQSLPEALERTIRAIEPEIKALISFIGKHEFAAVAGTASNYGVALEAAVKIQEAAYIFTRGDSTAGLLHGPIGALNEKSLVIPLVMESDLALSRQVVQLSRKLGADCLCIHPPDLELEDICNSCLKIPNSVDPLLAALVYLPPIQLITYYWALERNLNPDEPEAMRSILDAILPPGREEPELR
jgi:glucosamine--fructose-6-phosphate aminotransferase (isomerizing)